MPKGCSSGKSISGAIQYLEGVKLRRKRHWMISEHTLSGNGLVRFCQLAESDLKSYLPEGLLRSHL